MKRTTRTSQAGFSLVELMVVVAIIGVLASIAVPAVNKYIAKARQSEAKTNLASLYTSEKAFYSEYTTYDTRFQAIGYSPEGQLRYNVGFGAAGSQAGQVNGFNNTTIGAGTITTATYCGSTTGVVGSTSGCALLRGATGVANTLVPPATDTTFVGGTFSAGAVAIIHTGVPTGDRWTMTHNKVLTNTANGIP
ncbi:type IV pilin protein [Bdellovibrio sp. HCB290]|uniref:type IV pilin protein n=1 Tax=Bdellovibrio sp. HCB290 TaxID=3394356 RepID=UPI0039B6D460